MNLTWSAMPVFCSWRKSSSRSSALSSTTRTRTGSAEFADFDIEGDYNTEDGEGNLNFRMVPVLKGLFEISLSGDLSQLDPKTGAAVLARLNSHGAVHR